MNDWPPAYTVRKSKRAKRASIRIKHHHKIEIVIPERSRGVDPLALLNEHKTWVIKHLAKQQPVSESFSECSAPCKKEAYHFLLPLLEDLSQKHDLPYKQLQVRMMKTRWGSCRQDGKITLNSLLIFLPIELITHVILHELCHTRYMSHGPRFWSLLCKLDPRALINDKALKNVDQYLPRF